MGAYKSKVVSISGPGRDPGQRIIEECRDRLGKQLVEWLQNIGTEIVDDLFALADGTNDRLAQSRYLELRRKVQGNWPELATAFQHTLFQNEKPDGPVTFDNHDFAGLELIDDDKLSENIVIREFSARLAETCNDELYGLDRRIANLLNEDDIEKIENPLGPSLICHALAESCSSLLPDAENRLLLLRRLEKHLHIAQPEMYQTINRYLINLGILPDLKRTYRRASSTSGSSNNSASNSANQTFSAPASSGLSQPIDGNLLETLQRLAAARAGDPFTAALSNASPSAAGFSINQQQASFGAGQIGSSAQGGMQASSGDTAALSQAFFTSLEQFKQFEGEATVNQIQLIRASDAARNVGHVESVTIDIVAMLFDFIFNDQKIPNGVKALVGRLQIPVLKLAMLDQTFFGNRSHPARRFLDEISGIALRWGGSIDLEDPFYLTLAKLIDNIHDEFANDVEIFARALDELQAFVDQREQEEEATTKIATDIAARREHEAAAWERSHDAVREATAEAMPTVIADFYRQQWVEVLQRITARNDDQEEVWQDAIKLMSDLVHSVTPKKTSVERMALISTLPSLLSRVNKGLDIVNADKNERRPFFDALVDLHTTALKGDPPVAKPATQTLTEKPETSNTDNEATALTQPEATKDLPVLEIPGSKPGVDSNDTGDLIVTRSISNGVEVEEITLVGAKPTWNADHRQAAALVADLKRGDWVEFRHDDGSLTRERLTWMSPQRHLLVFSNHRAAKAISIAPDALAKKVRDGQAVILAEESIFDRAMNGVLETLNTAAA